MHSLHLAVAVTTLWSCASAQYQPTRFEARQTDPLGYNANNSLQVDLGYAIIEGVGNASTGLNTFFGVRYAAPPIGSLRWQPPQAPALNRSSVISAAEYGPICPQSFDAIPGQPFILGDEDCLSLNIYAPQNAVDLPVLVWIHGGGYGFYNGQQDQTELINTNNNSFIGVSIQYRLGAFGFLSSDEVYRYGVVNAGLLDQKFAFEWIQEHIGSFGGDPRKVTISGLSAGAGSVMLHTIAYGGTLGTSLFRNSITSSPYLPTQYTYNDFVPSQAYYAFATAAGCPPTYAYGNASQTIFACLQSQDTETLQKASNDISTSGVYGSWAFLPVTDGLFIQSTPSQALLKRKINGHNHLTSNMAEEGPAYTPQTIHTEPDLTTWLHRQFPLLTALDIHKILHYYPFTNTTTGLYPTSGASGPTAITTSLIASGHQQRANLILGESTFMCPSYWLATAFSSPDSASAHHAWKYQYSVPAALHGYDLEAYFGPARQNQGHELRRALQTSWGNFVRFGDPNGVDGGNASTRVLGEEEWPEFATGEGLRMVDFNQTGGTEFEFLAVQTNRTVVLFGEPGLRREVRVVDAWGWEGGRGVRCDFWRSLGGIVPE
ncbi:carboxylesterase type B [Polyplosphaeria fusca]|uniref:Carboxylic ester hydrolase n=1 Tax=Polyplosphaeria fusca TaxID=682080 RepID=A0A9P4UZE9_9PLEO|nr:carboxylesterase type B [Polyplosphaeria fusca]